MMPGSVEQHNGLYSAPGGSPFQAEPWPPVPEPGRVRYFKRYRMEIDLHGLPAPVLPEGYRFLAWRVGLLHAHAEVLFASFYGSIDAIVFPSLGDRNGSLYLMGEITRKAAFEPWATWLLAHGEEFCGTVQGVRERSGMGAIQNLGIVPSHRSRRLGSALLLQALHGFRLAGLGRALLEVTADNQPAVRLYHRLGFRRRKTIYKAVEVGAPFVAPCTADWADFRIV
jgi:ribosomal protein S18 acetylase RimI-like enzyme